MVAAHLGRDLLLRAVRQPAPAAALVLRLEHLGDVVDLVLRLDLRGARRLPVELLRARARIPLPEGEHGEHHEHEPADHDQGEGVDRRSVVCAPMRISARADYALRAAAELAAAGGGPVKGDALAAAQSLPAKFLENILADLRHARLVRSWRGPDGAYCCAHPAESISLADVIRAVEGPLASVRGE